MAPEWMKFVSVVDLLTAMLNVEVTLEISCDPHP